ncbi:chitooligosaccharidolytic beta-N-acetylglucosaminidase isoform X1 [Bemisia tabaci]|uniref:chitooligosaccharidolytic beta-N-acetylglucosaminidase isoform X1 n=2 Tax=Bemisia tabaci TaxID=7038 RepID=UPI003B2838AE
MNYRWVAVCFRRHFFKVFSTFCIYILCVSVLFFSITKVLKWRFVCLEPDDRPVWSWRCQAGKCVKIAAKSVNATAGEKLLSKNTCKLTCAPYGTLWPKPSGYIQVSSDVVSINPNSIYFQSMPGQVLPPKTNALLHELGQVFIRNIFLNLKGEPALKDPGHNFVVTVVLARTNVTTFTQDTDESYELTVSKEKNSAVTALVNAFTYPGAARGLETLLQLITYDDVTGSLIVPSAVGITDRPAYPYRGVLLDTARTFFSVEALKRLIDGLAASKMNTFHWHITDSHSFPFELKSHPQLTQYGAYDKKKVYTHDDIRSLVHYAQVRGIRIVPEFDAPAHVGEGWSYIAQPGDGPEDYVVCFHAEPWQSYCVEPPCGQLNPVSSKVYNVLSDIYSEMHELFDSDLFHMGGDEVNMNCWNSTESIVNWMYEKNMNRSDDDFHELWNSFQQEALKRLEAINNGKQKPIIWTSTLTTEARLKRFLDPKKYIVQIWTKGDDQTIANLVNNGYPVIFSNYDALYFDCGFGAWVGEGNNWCSPFIPWQKVYENDPMKLLSSLGVDATPATRRLVLGAEAALWTEQADEHNADSRLWPRVAALAERLWSDPQEGWESAEHRFLHHRERLVQRGLRADSVEPEWCYQNEGSCYLTT